MIFKGMNKWELAIHYFSSTRDIIFYNPTGDYRAKFLSDKVVNNFKFPVPKQYNKGDPK